MNMDERIEKALEFSHYRITLKSKRNNLKRKVESKLIHSDSGGQFKLSQDFICFVDLMVRQGNDDLFLLDRDQTPVRIKHPEQFLKRILRIYHSTLNEYFHEYKKISTQRTVKKLIDE